MTVAFTNFASTRTTSILLAGGTSVSVTPGTGANLPATAGSAWFYLVLTDSLTAPTVREVIKVTNRSTDSLATIIRAQDGTTALEWPSGSYCELRLNKGALDDIRAEALAVANNLSEIPSPLAARNNLQLGSMATQNANNVLISGGAAVGVALAGGTLDAAPVGSGTPDTGAFTALGVSGATSLADLAASGTVSGAGFDTYLAAALAAPPAIGGTTPAAINGTVITGKAGVGTGTPVMVGTLSLNVTPVGNVGVGEDTLMSYTLPANSFSASGKAVRVKMWGYTSSNGNAKSLTFYFGSELLQAFNPVANEQNYWTVEIIMARYDVAVQTKYIHTTIINNNLVALADILVGSAAEDETAAILIRATGEGTDDNDVVQSGMIVEFIN